MISTSIGLPSNTIAAPTMDVRTTQGRSDPNAKVIARDTTRTNIRLVSPVRKPQRIPSIKAAPQEQPSFSINIGETLDLIGVYERYTIEPNGTRITVDDLVYPTVNSQPEIPGATYSFDPNPVRAFTDVKVSINTALESTPGVYTTTYGGTSRADGMAYAPYVFQLAVKPAIAPTVFNPTIWWFNLVGLPQRDGYPTSLRLEALPPGEASYQWEIVSGSDKAILVVEPGNSAVIYSTRPSVVEDDIAVRVTVNSVVSDEFRFTIRDPDKLIFLSYSDTVPNATQPWQTYVNYEVRDQFDQPLPEDISWNEFFTTNKINDTPNNWQRKPPSGATQNPEGLADRMNSPTRDPRVTPTPILLNRDAPSKVKVLHFDGEWRVGNTTPGTGRRVQKNTWQDWLDRGRHPNRITPYP